MATYQETQRRLSRQADRQMRANLERQAEALTEFRGYPAINVVAMDNLFPTRPASAAAAERMVLAIQHELAAKLLRAQPAGERWIVQIADLTDTKAAVYLELFTGEADERVRAESFLRGILAGGR